MRNAVHFLGFALILTGLLMSGLLMVTAYKHLARQDQTPVATSAHLKPAAKSLAAAHKI